MQMDMKRPRVSRRASLAADGAHRNLRLKNSECDQFIRFNDFTSFNIHIIILESVVFFRIVKFIFLNLITLEKEVWKMFLNFRSIIQTVFGNGCKIGPAIKGTPS